ncbi:hypothetical protein HY310_03555 [Candidatus Microgenomates bacterium]|nr:hypothetical protein [Candidatus Microgenomates bacterium]
MGSYGVGFTLNEGVCVDVSKSVKTKIIFNNQKINFPTVKSVAEKLAKGKKERLRISIKSKLPLGCGFGLSGASALAAAYAANNLLKLNLPNKELAIIAHTAEVENKTGLGDVVNQYYGGFCLKQKPSSHFIVKKLPINNADVYCTHFSRLSTSSIIANPKLKNGINKSASIALNKIQHLIKNNNNIQFGNIIKISKEFALNSGLLNDKKTIKTIGNIEENNGNASMIMLGNAVFSDKYFKGSTKFRIKDKGACLL